MQNPFRGMTPQMQMFIRCIVAGDTPEQAIRLSFPEKKTNLDVWAAKYLASPKIQRAIDMLIKAKVNPQARRIELIKLKESADSSPATRLGAIKELARMDGNADEEPKKKAVNDDDALQRKLHILGEKAAS
jgi:hypothetical protein